MSTIQDLDTTLEIEEVSQHSAEEGFVEAMKLIRLASQYNEAVNHDPEFIAHMFKEFLHWMFAKRGTHQTPTALLKELIDEKIMEESASTDAPPKKGETND